MSDLVELPAVPEHQKEQPQEDWDNTGSIVLSQVLEAHGKMWLRVITEEHLRILLITCEGYALGSWKFWRGKDEDDFLIASKP